MAFAGRASPRDSHGRVGKRGNRILDGLPAQERQLVVAGVEHTNLVPGEVVCRAGARVKHVIFPCVGVISLFVSPQGGPDVGVGVVGAAGMVGLAAVGRRAVSTLSAVSQGHGVVDRIEARGFLALLARSAGLRAALLVYGSEWAAQMAQNTACALLHPAQRRLARWLLDVADGSPGGRLSTTQVDMALALGLQRSAVSRSAGSLQELGLIRYVRGEVDIVDRAGLAAVACACSHPLR